LLSSQLLLFVRTTIGVLILGATACGRTGVPPNPTTAPISEPTYELALVTAKSSGQWARYRADGGPRAVDVYLAHDLRPKPVVVLLHGSSCTPEFTVDADGSFHETSLFQDAIASSLTLVHFAVVERQGVEPLAFTAGLTQEEKRKAFERAEQECTAEYFQTATKPIRVEDAIAAIRSLRQQPWVTEVILAGHSEGTQVVTGVLRDVEAREISAAGLFASAGPIRFFCGYAARNAGDREAYERTFDRIRMLQQADDDVIWEGLPARRWKTFWLGSTPIEDVRDSSVPLFVGHGSRDDTTLCADLFTLEAIRQQPERPIRYVVVENGDHSFATPDGRWLVSELFKDFLQWALDANRQTGLASLK